MTRVTVAASWAYKQRGLYPRELSPEETKRHRNNKRNSQSGCIVWLKVDGPNTGGAYTTSFPLSFSFSYCPLGQAKMGDPGNEVRAKTRQFTVIN